MSDLACARRPRTASAQTLQVRSAFARNIRLWAEARGLSLNLLADRSGVSRAQMYNVLAGASSPSLDWIAKVAPALGLEAWQLLIQAEPPPYGVPAYVPYGAMPPWHP